MGENRGVWTCVAMLVLTAGPEVVVPHSLETRWKGIGDWDSIEHQSGGLCFPPPTLPREHSDQRIASSCDLEMTVLLGDFVRHGPSFVLQEIPHYGLVALSQLLVAGDCLALDCSPRWNRRMLELDTVNGDGPLGQMKMSSES